MNPDHSLFEPIAHLGYNALAGWAWSQYKPTVLALAHATSQRTGQAARVLEIGAGRAPLFDEDEATRANIELTLNDIDSAELARATPRFSHAQFDIADPAAIGLEHRERYDLVISRMVLEHVSDARVAWSNSCRLLCPGGIALAFFPTLYATPFVLNRLLPERVSSRVLRWVFPQRQEREVPKFPARYDACVSAPARLQSLLRDVGFASALVLPFWTHDYFDKLPLLGTGERMLQLRARAHDWRLLSSYAYVLAQK